MTAEGTRGADTKTSRGHRVVARARPGRTWATAPGAGASPEGSPPLTHRDTPATPVATRTPAPTHRASSGHPTPSSDPPQAPDTFLQGAGELRTPTQPERRIRDHGIRIAQSRWRYRQRLLLLHWPTVNPIAATSYR